MVLRVHALKSMQAFERCTLIVTATRQATKGARTWGACSEMIGLAKFANGVAATEQLAAPRPDLPRDGPGCDGGPVDKK